MKPDDAFNDAFNKSVNSSTLSYEESMEEEAMEEDEGGINNTIGKRRRHDEDDSDFTDDDDDNANKRQRTRDATTSPIFPEAVSPNDIVEGEWDEPRSRWSWRRRPSNMRLEKVDKAVQ